MTNNEISTNKIQKSDLIKTFWRSFTLEASFSYERMQALGYAFCMIPIFKRLYKTKEQMSEALKRHMDIFNTTPHVVSFIMGISAAMEEQNSNDKNFDSESINSVKVALMGPMAGIGDSFFWGTLRVIAAGIGVSLATKGSILGAILFLLIFNIPHLLVRYYGLFLGYKAGTSILKSASENGIMQKLSKGATIIGLMVVGAMTGTMVTFATPLNISIGGASVKIQEIFDQILPALLPLSLTFFVYYLVKKGIKTNYILVGLLVFGVLGKMIGIL